MAISNSGITADDQYNAGSVAISGGTINGTVIGGTTPAAGSFTTISFTAATGTSVSVTGALSGASAAISNTNNATDWTPLRVMNVGNGSGGGSGIEAIGARNDGNASFFGRAGLAHRRSDGTAIASGTVGMVAFGGQWGTDTSYTAAKVLYPASIKGIAESSYSSASAMATAIAFFTGVVGDALTAANLTYGTEAARITSTGLFQFGKGVSITAKAVVNNGSTTTYTYPAATSYVYITTSAASLATTLPAASSAIDGLMITYVPSANVATATWVSSGATFVGAPAALTANVPVRMIYNHSDTKWYPA